MGGLAKGAGGALGEVLSKIGGAGDGGNPLPLPGESQRRSANRPGGTSGDYAPRPAGPPAPVAAGAQSAADPGRRSPRSWPVQPRTRHPSTTSPTSFAAAVVGGGIELPRSPGGGIEIPGGGGRPINLAECAGGSLWSIIRSILGSVLGFEGKGFFGWLVRLIV